MKMRTYTRLMLRQYVRLMRTHDFSYQYSDSPQIWQKENQKRITIMMLKTALLLLPLGRKVVIRTESKYGEV